MEVHRSKLIGYCHGVSNTIKLARTCLHKAEKAGLPCYSIGHLIHNSDAVREFETQGMKVIQEPSDAQPGIALIRAHGIPDELRNRFIKSGYQLIDSTCENIKQTKEQIEKAYKKKRVIIVLGKANHAETKGLRGCIDSQERPIETILLSSEDDYHLLEGLDKKTPVTVVTQTTFPEELFVKLTSAIKQDFPNADFGNRLCQACLIRKTKILQLSEKVEVIVVVGGKESENTQNLADYLRNINKPVLCIENKNDLDNSSNISFLKQFSSVGVCSGTSTPIEVIDDVCEQLERL